MARLLGSSWALGLILGLALPSSAPGEGLFRSGIVFPYGGTPATEVVLADLDLDGRADLVVGGEISGQLHVFLGRPDAIFSEPKRYRQIGNNSTAFALGKLDGDEYPDIVTANSGNSSISVFLNAGDGSFRTPSGFQVGLQPRTAALADFDLDGKLDVAVNSLTQDPKVDILLGDGQGFLGSRRTIGTGDNPHWLLAGDYDGDLVPDLVIAESFGVSFRRGSGNGSFEDPILTDVRDPQRIVPGDINQDGLLDLSYCTEETDVGVLLNLGNGSFRAITLAPQSAAIRSGLVDFNADGFLDVVALSATGTLRVYVGKADEVFEAPRDLYLDALAKGFAVSDLSGDALPDLLVTRSDKPEVRLYTADAPGELGTRRRIGLGERPGDLLELHGRQRTTLVAVSTSKLHVLTVENRLLAHSKTLELPGSAFLDAEAGDFDNDGLDDIALADTAGNRAFVARLDGANDIGSAVGHDVAGSPAKLAAGDLDRDGFLDLAISDLAYPAISVIKGPLFDENATAFQLPVASGQRALVVADLNGDAHPDIAASHGVGLQLLLGDGRGGFESMAVPDLESAYELRAADLDGDGAMDLAGTSNARVVIRFGVAGGGTRRAETRLPKDGRALEAVDIDGDGRLDLLTATDDVLHVLRNGVGGTFSVLPEDYRGVGLSPRALVVKDFGVDGILDVAVAAYPSREIVVLLGSAPRSAFRRGDANADGAAGITDAIVVLESLFLGGGELPCPDAGDADDSGRLELTDAVYLLLHLFQGGPAPPAPGPAACGADPTADELAGCGASCG